MLIVSQGKPALTFGNKKSIEMPEIKNINKAETISDLIKFSLIKAKYPGIKILISS
jgi:hypothetical protein